METQVLGLIQQLWLVMVIRGGGSSALVKLDSMPDILIQLYQSEESEYCVEQWS